MTDPPYGVDVAGKMTALKAWLGGNQDSRAVANDSTPRQAAGVLRSALLNAPLAPRNTVYVFLADKTALETLEVLRAARVKFSTFVIWCKNGPVFSFGDYSYAHELIAYGWRGRHEFYGGYQRSVIFEANTRVSPAHPNSKPVRLIRKLIVHGSPPDGVVYDPFLGAGTTLLACEREGRRCRAIEIVPGYVEVALRRWRRLAGREPTLGGKTIEEAAAERVTRPAAPPESPQPDTREDGGEKAGRAPEGAGTT